MKMGKLVGSGKFTYGVDEDWAHLPDGWGMPAAAVAVDSKDRVFCFNRTPDHPIMVFDRDGNYLFHWGEGQFQFPHSIFIDARDDVWLVDRNLGQVMKFTTDGQLLMTIGTAGHRSDTGADADSISSTAYKDVTHGGEPFNLPAGICVAPSGQVFVADGYGNCRVHKFSPEGEHILSWGEPGNGPGQFMLPHGVWVDRQGRVLVADRENDRVEAFNQDGELLESWKTDFIGPALFYVDDEDIVYIPEHNGGLVSILDLDGNRLAQWGGPIHRSCHGIWVDSHRDLYVVQPGDSGGPRKVVKYIRQ